MTRYAGHAPLVKANVILHSRCFILIVFLVVSHPVITFQTLTANKDRAYPAKQSQATEEAPGQCFAFGLDVDRECEESPRHERAEAASQG